MGLKKSFRGFIRLKVNPAILTAIVILSVLGLLNLAGILGFDSVFFKKQLVFFILGIFILFLNPLIDYRIFKNYSLPSAIFFAISIFLLLITLKSTPVRGVAAWLHFPLGISFETSEIVKLAMILFLARYFSSRINLRSFSTILISVIYTFLVIFLVFSQPDLGSAIIILLIWLGGISLFGLTKRQVLIAANFFVIVALFMGFFILQPYQKDRISSFFESILGQSRESYNVLQS